MIVSRKALSSTAGSITDAPSSPPPRIIVFVPGPVIIEGFGARMIVYACCIKYSPIVVSGQITISSYAQVHPRHYQHLLEERHEFCHLPVSVQVNELARAVSP